MRNTAGASSWLVSVPDEHRWVPLSGDVQTDTVVVGDGMAGVMAAWCLAEAGRDVVLLEKNHIATGDTGFTTAFLTRVPDVPLLSELARKSGQDCVNEVFAANRSAQKYLAHLIEQFRIPCGYHEVPSYYGTPDAKEATLAEQWPVVHHADPDVEFLRGSTIPQHIPFAQAIRFGHEAKFDVRQFLFGLLKQPAAQRIKVFEETEARTIAVENSVHVTTSQGSVSAKHVVVATGNPHPSFAELQKLVTRKITFAMTAEYQHEVPLSDALFWDTEMPYHYFRRLNDRTIMLGGADHRLDQHPATSPHDVLAQFLESTFHEKCTIRNAWSGLLYETADSLPIVSTHSVHGEKVLVITGFCGNGMVMGVMAGLLVRDLIEDNAPRVARYFAVRN